MNKKQMMNLIVGSIIVFIIMFGLCYAFFYSQGTKEPLITDETVETSLNADGDNGEMITQIASQKLPQTSQQTLPIESIQADTKIKLQIIDETGQVIQEKEIDAVPLLGMTETQIKERFSTYDKIIFDEEETVIQKVSTTNKISSQYRIVIQDGIIGIKSNEELEEEFISLNIPKEVFSKSDLEYFQGEGLEISQGQKIQLQQQPYYIEKILQDFQE
ncbi:MAG: hypothetical protein ACRCSG_07650 [Cellulosilyticaceae bacterium]